MLLSGIISSSNANGKLVKTGTSRLTLSGGNSYTGTTTVTGGALILGASNVLPDASAIYFNGGTFVTGGFSETVSSLILSNNSTIQFGSGNHTLTCTTAGTFTASTILTIKDWQGVYAAPGTTGTAGKLQVNSLLTAGQLAQIKFFNTNTSANNSSIQLASKEVVSGN